MIKWYSKLEGWAKRLIAIAAILTALSPIISGTIKVSKKYVKFVIEGPQLVEDISELKNSLYVLTGVVAANMPYVDNNEYYLYLNNRKVIGRIKVATSGDLYVFVPDDEMGEKTFAVNYNKDRDHYYFIDFSGRYIELIKK